ncbi:RteC domain-containing protein [Parapedobacter sp. ISTM3]|uniref:RteC domain-containing protein n=1 Tax=Parapedobacter sp. ISTM3 TaxID=2800130 RepID=UPI0019046960|nr:RteC domain-containing protein [Parapedobacter sp. ISTM3]MBK1442265.1 RteC domain-containing protein [Parapedobacter sp. ISTM3]
MEKYYEKCVQRLDEQINELKLEIENPIILAQELIELLLNYLGELKKYVSERGFKSIEEEIHFFKRLKPVILAKLIYYNAIYKIETKKPYGNGKAIKKYIDNELSKLKRYFDNNLEFYKYYRTNSTYLDEKYFVRGRYDVKLSLDTYYFETDHNFTTSHDYKVAKIIANDLIQVYLEDQLNNTNQKKKFERSPLNWTASKTALTELIYALYAQGVFDNGNADIKAIAKVFEQMFNIDLGDFYHTFMELKARKINPTKFLDSLRDALIRKMDEQEE